jgi:pyruvate/2-oxoglutarate dehydrogenase complex dihydrolipoamide dehydrogenase (E3) component
MSPKLDGTIYCGPKIAGFGLNVAEKKDAKAAIRVSPVIFFTTTKVVRMKETNMKAENACSKRSRSEFKLMLTPPSVATALNMIGRPGG